MQNDNHEPTPTTTTPDGAGPGPGAPPPVPPPSASQAVAVMNPAALAKGRGGEREPVTMADIDLVARARQRVLGELRKRIIGQDEVIDLLMTSLFAGGHGLFIGVPGLAKTLLIQTLAEAVSLRDRKSVV